MSFLPELTDVYAYKPFQSKFIASVRWLITRVFDREVPDKLREVACSSNEQEEAPLLSVAVQTALTNGSLYGQAAAKIFKDVALLQSRPEQVLQSLMAAGQRVCYRVNETDEVQVTEAHLMSAEPFVQQAHVAMIDALMTVHVDNTCTTERAIDSVSRYTMVYDHERPLDAADALLFWINKICMLVRDDVEKNGLPLKGSSNDGTGGVIPEMEDLYEDISDGCCLCALVSFYWPQKIDLTEICFHETMSMTESHYNFLLIQRFCDSLPCNPWHFSTEDMLYMHDSMQINVNAFLADLFDLAEPPKREPPESIMTSSTTSSPRRFVPIEGIPGLRSGGAQRGIPSKMNMYDNMRGSLTAPRAPRSMSVISADSLATGRPAMPLSARLQQEQQWGGNVTGFGTLSQMDANGGGIPRLGGTEHLGGSPLHGAQGLSTGGVPGGTYVRSDSLPVASIRLALEEKRREHERKKALASTMTDADREEKKKAAFFALMTKHSKNADPEATSKFDRSTLPPETSDVVETLSRKVLDLQAQVEQMTMQREGERLSRATSQPSILHEQPPPQQQQQFSLSGNAYNQQAFGGGVPALPPQQQQHQQQQQQQNEYYYSPNTTISTSLYGASALEGTMHRPMRPSLSNGVLNYMPGQPQQPALMNMQGMQQPQQQMYDPMGMQHQQGMYMMQQQQPQQGYGMQPMGMQQNMQPSHYQQSFMQQPQMQQQPMHPIGMMAPPPMYDEALKQLHNQQQHQMGNHGAMEHNHGMQHQVAGGSDDADGGFRLHHNEGSRLDPPLELNRNLTNWGLAYRQGSAGQRSSRRAWENETFVKSELDLVNQRENVPSAEEAHQQQQTHQRPMTAFATDMDRPSPLSMGRRTRSSREDTPASGTSTISSRHGTSEAEGPPRDPTTKESYSGETLHEFDSGDGSPAISGAFVVDDEASTDDLSFMAEQRRQAKREALLAKTMKRKEEITHKVDTIEARNAERRAAEQAKQMMADQRKLEKELQRQKILEEYKRRKVEKEMDSARSGSVSSVRGSSQPPFARTKSQGVDTPRLGTAGSATPRARGQSNVLDEAKKIVVPSCAEPSLKLFAKATPKSNRNLITNALQFSVFPGAVSSDSRNKVLTELAKSDSKHVLLLFRDHKCQYRGLYEWDQVSDSVFRLHGTGPKVVTDAMMQMMFKYDSGTKIFNHIPTKHLSATIDGFTIKDEYWQKKVTPHSAAPKPSRDN